MKLADLVPPEADLPVGAATIDIAAITADSRQVKAGTLFAAIPGTRFDGARFIPDAVAAGAAAILAAADADIHDCPVPVMRAVDPRRILAFMAARLYARQPETTVAVTGTSGKSSVAEFTRQIFMSLGHRAASVGTIGIVKPDGSIYGSLTTPDPVMLHAILAELADEGVTHLAFEASSHGLDQRRLDGVKLAAAAFTNLGRDHLDYHPTIEDYLAAKLRLFDTLLPEGGGVVLNADVPEAARITEIARARQQQIWRIGCSEDATLRLDEVQPDGFGQRIVIAYEGKLESVRLHLIGTYQAMNALTAAGLALAVGAPFELVVPALEKLAGVRGRLEVVGAVRGATVVIDYAHKPDALAAALDALRPFVTGQLICVFGCGGDRDPGKRAIMGQISAAKADVTVVTDDNPRSEDPAAIRAAILAAAPGAREISSRGEAIAAALAMAGPGDVVLIAGKGHETGQIVGDKILPFCDHDAVAAVLKEM
ncbi:MAG: UDP-N-acetylmuramoyl-L-alanyl-D-glutamate--2,6-diaminopimelate ligase [Pseudomonadota bacterium]